jgi:diguanylate cyclase (GGDEF)-like protein/PAS domain S-box-containing protein
MPMSNKEAFHYLFDQIDKISVQGYNESREVIYWNKASELLYGYSETDALGKKLENLIIPKSMQTQVINAHEAWLNNGSAIESAEVSLCKLDGSLVDVYSSHVLIKNKKNEKQMYCVDIDLSNLKSVEKKIQQKELVLKGVLKAIPDLFFLMSFDGVIIDYYANQSNELYFSPESFIGKSVFDILPTDIAQNFFNHIEQAKEKDGLITFEYQIGTDEEQKGFEVRLNRLPDSQNLIVMIRDVSERNKTLLTLKETEQRLQDLFNNIPSAIYVKDLQGKYLSINKEFEQLFHVLNKDIKGKNDFDIFPESIAKYCQESDKKVEQLGHSIETEEDVDVDGVSQTFHSVKYPLFDAQGSMYAVCGISTNITDKKKSADKIYYQAHYDALTHLPNRFLALDRLSQHLIEAKRNKDKVGILFLDLDDFKKINDSLGHEVGDKLLIEAAERLTKILRSEDTVGRLGGDEFIILLRGLSDAKDALTIADNILNSFKDVFKIDGRELVMTVSVGIAIYPDDGDNSSQLLRNADTAMYQSKNLGRNTYSFFTEKMNHDISRRLLIEEHIRGALERNEFEVYYQAQLDVFSERIIGAEALLRWKNPVLGNVSPVEFIPIIEQTGMIIPIGKYVIQESLCMLNKWQELSNLNLRIAVNLSPRQFRDPELINFIKTMLEVNDIEAKYLELEITEGVLMIGHSYIKEALKELNQLGILLSMDDFGTGYSSLSYLRQYSFDVLKVDRSFINGIADESADRDLVNATIAMAHSLGLKVVAEGVENEEQLFILNEFNCDYVQGFYFSKPIPEKEFFEFALNYEVK